MESSLASKTILSTIKGMLGVQEDVDAFDEELLAYLNSAFLTLSQLGIGTNNKFMVDKYTLWGDFETQIPYEVLQTYLYLKVRLVFDPPQTHVVMDAMKSQIQEYEWRLNAQVDYPWREE